MECISVEVFGSEHPGLDEDDAAWLGYNSLNEVIPAVVRKRAKEMLDKLPTQGFGNLTRAHVRIAGRETVYELVDMKFKQVVK